MKWEKAKIEKNHCCPVKTERMELNIEKSKE